MRLRSSRPIAKSLPDRPLIESSGRAWRSDDFPATVTRLPSISGFVELSAAQAGSSFSDSLRQVHLRIGLIVLLSLLPASPLLASLSIETQLALVALPIALLGVMHGGLDPWVGDVVLQRSFGRCSRWMFFTAYLAVMAGVTLCWIALPLPTLVAFLLVSVLHFGEQDASAFASRTDGLSVAVFGALPVLGPVAAHPAEVATIFGWLIGMDAGLLSETLRWLARPLIALWIVGAGMFIGRTLLERDPNPAFQVFGLLVLVSAMLLLPPLIAFAAYFCLLHSFGHLLDMAALESGPWRKWTLPQWTARLWPATLGALALGLVGWVALTALGREGFARPEALAQVIFCGLAALTVPHVLLHMIFSRQP